MTELRAIPELPTIEQVLQCPMCLDRFEKPKLLPCGHTFCQTCLECRSRTNHVRCPLDEKSHPLPINGVAGFPSNVTADVLADIVFSSSKSSGKAVAKYCCSDCGEMCPELRRCFNHCSAMLCEHCLEEHADHVTREIETALTDLRTQLKILKDTHERWETQRRILYISFENAKSELDKVFKVCYEKLRQKHAERQEALKEMVTPHLDAFKTKVCKARECAAKAEQMCVDLEARLRRTDKIRDVELFCIRLRCLQQMALLEDYVMKDQGEQPCGKIETVTIELDEDWMNFCIGKLFRKSIVSRLGSEQ